MVKEATFGRWVCVAVCLATSTSILALDSEPQKLLTNELAQAINLNESNDWPLEPKAPPIIIAVIDDGYVIDHPSLKGFEWVNQQEIINNNSDDDGNGAVDDIFGWDVADADGNVAPPPHRRQDFFHGTFVASVIADLIRAKLGPREKYPIQFMYVKAVSDSSTSMLVSSGYIGVDYAANNGAEIINNSWDGGQLREADSAALNNARSKGVFIVNSIGNFPSQTPSVPASHPAVFGVAGSDLNGVITRSNYGPEADLTAPAIDIVGANAADQTQTIKLSGTSFAAPLVSATAALMKLANRELSASQITSCLHNSANFMDHRNPMIAGKLGAGMLNVDDAIECARDPLTYQFRQLKQTPKGSFGISVSRKVKKKTHSWLIDPVGVYAGLSLLNSVSGKPGKSTVTFSSALDPSSEPLWTGSVSDLPPTLYFDIGQVNVELINSKRSNFKFFSRYQATPIDFEKRYCTDRTLVQEKTIIEDGSGELRYAALSDCEWLIEGRTDHSIVINFTHMDIDSSDTLYVFSGESRRQRDLLTTLTGDSLPARMIIQNGPVLLWFVSNGERQGQGFSASIDWLKK